MAFTLSRTGTSISLSTGFGYQSTITLGLDFIDTPVGRKSFDNGTSSDNRICKISTGYMNYTSAIAVYNFLEDATLGRGNDLYMAIPLNENFHPFGPDLTYNTSFAVAVVRKQWSGQLDNPWLYYKLDLDLLLRGSLEAYTPSLVSEGSMRLFGVTGLNYPANGFTPKYDYGLMSVYKYGGTVSHVDTGVTRKVVPVEIDANLQNSANLLNYLSATLRGNSAITYTDDDYKLFGISPKLNSSNIYAKLSSNKIVCTHKRHNQFSLKFELANEMTNYGE